MRLVESEVCALSHSLREKRLAAGRVWFWGWRCAQHLCNDRARARVRRAFPWEHSIGRWLGGGATRLHLLRVGGARLRSHSASSVRGDATCQVGCGVRSCVLGAVRVTRQAPQARLFECYLSKEVFTRSELGAVETMPTGLTRSPDAKAMAHAVLSYTEKGHVSIVTVVCTRTTYHRKTMLHGESKQLSYQLSPTIRTRSGFRVCRD